MPGKHIIGVVAELKRESKLTCLKSTFYIGLLSWYSRSFWATKIGYLPNFLLLDEGEYVIPMCTIFGLEPEEKVWLVANQAKCGLTDQLTDKNRDEDGIEVATSAYRVGFKRLYIDKMFLITLNHLIL